MLSDSFRHHLRAFLFGSTEFDGWQSHNQYTTITSGAYNNKPVPFVWNRDIAEGSGDKVFYRTVTWNNFLLPGEMDELNAHFTSDYRWEIRIVEQRQWKNKHGSDYPSWQIFSEKRLTPYDLNDVASMLGYRGAAQDAYRNTWPTGIISSQSITSGVIGYYLNNSLRNQTPHHPRPSANHPPAGNQWNGNYAAWGRPAILNLGDTRVKNYGATGLLNMNTLIWHGTGTVPTSNIAFETNNGQYRINNLYQSITGGDYNILHSGYFKQVTGHNLAWNSSSYYFYTYEFKKSLTKNDILNGINGYLNFPIGRHAVHVLKRRDYKTLNDRIPDCFNYTIAVVIYKKESGTNNWRVDDIIFDRLRTIDRWDVDHYLDDSSYGEIDYKHPSIRINTAGEPIYSTGNTYTLTFSNIPSEWMSNHFFTNLSSEVRLDENDKDNWVRSRIFLISPIEDFSGEVVQDRIYKLSLGTQHWGTAPVANENFTTNAQMDITAYYLPQDRKLRVSISAYGVKHIPNGSHPLLVWYQ